MCNMWGNRPGRTTGLPELRSKTSAGRAAVFPYGVNYFHYCGRKVEWK